MTDDARLAEKLLRLAASTHSESEAASAAVKAAKLFAGKRLRVEAEKSVVTCPLCAPARPESNGACGTCGYRGPGPGHACTNRDPSVVCEAHRTWPVASTPIFAGPVGSLFGPPHFVSFRSVSPDEEERRLLRRRVEELEKEKAALEQKVAEMTKPAPRRRRGKRATAEKGTAA